MTRPRNALALPALAAVLLSGRVAAAQSLPALPPSQPPSTPPPARAVPAVRAVEVRFEPDAPGLQVYSLGGVVPVERVVVGYWGWWYERGFAPLYSPICSAPCSANMAPGAYRIALAKPGRRPVPATEPAVLRAPSLVRGHYTDRSGLRTAGLAIGIAGTVGGIAMIIASADGSQTVCNSAGLCYDRTHVNEALLSAGIGVILVTVVAGALLGMEHDTVHVEVQPLQAPSMGSLGEPAMDALAWRAQPQGAALTLRF